jgi:hypothetical protein
MYSNKLVASIKSNGKILREFNDKVYVPFGTEYSILIKNLNTVRASVNIFVDGTDAGDGSSFVVKAGETFELSRFLKNGNLNQGNQFKFIERTAAVSNHRGVGIEDGLIRVEFVFERPLYRYPDFLPCNNPTIGVVDAQGFMIPIGPVNYSTTNITASSISSATFRTCSSTTSSVGITVPGSISDQTFETIAAFPVETVTHSVILHLVGETGDGDLIVDPITVKSKPKCTSCGKQNKATAKFCIECGTSLTIV